MLCVSLLSRVARACQATPVAMPVPAGAVRDIEVSESFPQLHCRGHHREVASATPLGPLIQQVRCPICSAIPHDGTQSACAAQVCCVCSVSRRTLDHVHVLHVSTTMLYHQMSIFSSHALGGVFVCRRLDGIPDVTGFKALHTLNLSHNLIGTRPDSETSRDGRAPNDLPKLRTQQRADASSWTAGGRISRILLCSSSLT